MVRGKMPRRAHGGVRTFPRPDETLAFSIEGVKECNSAWVLKKSSFLPNNQNFGDTKCLEN
jgi:hypothetical protein